jgi:hypothetical protein
MMNAKDRAVEIFNSHIALAASDGRLFRKTVMEQLKDETGCSQAAAATHYNNAKKLADPIEGLGRVPQAAGVRKMSLKGKKEIETIPDNECFSVIEVVAGAVRRTQSFDTQGNASENFDERVMYRPETTWLLIQGLGPNSGDSFKLEAGEKEIKRHTAVVEV